MQCTPESRGLHDGCKVQHCYDCSDSGYSGLFHTPQSISGVDSCTSLSSDFSETPKENIKLSATPKARSKESVRRLGKDSRWAQRSSAISWSETPKVHKRDAIRRHRLLLGTPTTDVKTKDSRSPRSKETFSNSVKSEHWLSESFDSLDTVSRDLTLKPEQDLPLSGRKRRILFSQVRTSTLEDGTVNSGQLANLERQIFPLEADFSESISASETPEQSKCLTASPRESTESPVSRVRNEVHDNCSVLFTPSSTQTPKYMRCLYEDSGFSSLTLDKSQDSSVDHDGSFQELLHCAFRGNSGTPNLADTRLRSRLQRQHRLSTLKEGGSQSEEDQVERKYKHEHQEECPSHCKDDEVFDGGTPCKVLGEAQTSTKQDYATPLSATSELKNNPHFSATPVNSTVTPFKTSDLSLTPALQLVQALCQQNAQMFIGQSPSLQEQMKSTAALVHTPLMFRTTMPLAGLIGRKMGIGKMDILTELKRRNLRHILALILSNLTAKCICRCSRVCTSWNDIVKQDKQASLRRGIYLVEVEAALELRGAAHVPDAETRHTLLTRSALKTVQVQSRTSSFCTPQSGSSTFTPLQDSTLLSGCSSKREKFLEVAKTLFSDECLKPCPRCQHPAKCHSVKKEGVCTKTDCGFQFCTACLCAFHGSRECGSRSVGRRKKDILLPGSAQSKRNIRRL